MKQYTLPGRVCSTAAIREIALDANEPYTLITLSPSIEWVYLAQERMIQVMESCHAQMVYADHFNLRGDMRIEAPVIDYQQGALRDDFDFGSVMLWRTSTLKQLVEKMDVDYQYSGLYDLRLKATVHQTGDCGLVHIPEYLYYEIEQDSRKSGEKLFDYVNPKNREVQIEMEQCVTRYLRDTQAYLTPGQYLAIPASTDIFPVTASVIIPCRNRARTIEDAIRSALSQKTEQPYTYNVIVVDDNSTDGTVEIIQKLQQEFPQLIYIAQDTTWHAIGGNWNVAIHDPRCGRYAIQLDSDDTYYDSQTVQRFIDAFEQNTSTPRYAMVIGTYQMTDIHGNILPPGIISHNEWTDENGRNNALRINGLGAPRGFYVPLLRQINFPTTKYGEDYAVGLRISRDYPLGRIYDVIYNCRRWDDNSDANCDIPAMNRNNWYKDRLRTWELQARIAQNSSR